MGIRAALQNGRTRTVAKQNAGVTIGPVHDGGEFFGADHQHGVVRAGGDKLLADFQRVNESRAGGFDVERGRPIRADLLLDQAGGRRKRHVRRDGSHDDQLDLLG